MFLDTASKKIIKFIYNTQATLLAGLGFQLKCVNNHAKIIRKKCIQTPGESIYHNDLEEKFYGVEEEIRFHHPERFLYVLKDIWVVGSEGLIFLGPNTLFSCCPSTDELNPKKIRRPIPFLSKNINEPVFILSGRAPGNRAHFLYEHLPRLIAAKKHLQNSGNVKILVTPNHASWQRGYLEKFGFPPGDIVEASEGATFCKKAFYIPLLSAGDREVICHEAYYKEIYKLFADDEQIAKLKVPVFLSRKDAKTRKLANEDSLFQIAAEYFPGIKRVVMSGLSLAEQIDIFQKASVLIGPHGQPFRNVLFSSKALVIQLVPGERNKSNEYHMWSRNFNCIGTLSGNNCISLYNEDQSHSGALDWTYSEDKFKQELINILQILKK